MNTAAKPQQLFPDPKESLLKKLGDISEIDIAQNEVLLAMYMRPRKRRVASLWSPKNLDEDKFQGKVGLVVKIGPACRFIRKGDDGVIYGIDIKLHDWVAVRTSDTWSLEINPDPNVSDPRAFTLCRLVFDDQIRLKVPHPAVIW